MYHVTYDHLIVVGPKNKTHREQKTSDSVPAQAFLWGVAMLTLCQCGFSPPKSHSRHAHGELPQVLVCELN